MSRYYRTGTDPGLSRQSSKSYKAVRQKSNAELNEKLRRLDMEHQSNISKLLTERYTLRTIHYNLTHSGEESSEEDSDGGEDGPEEIAHYIVPTEEECLTVEKKVQGALQENSKKQNFLQLPSIIEESSVISKQKSPKLGHSPLPPLSEHGFPTRVRRNSENNHDKATTTRQRQRSSSLPIGHMPAGDRQRKGEFKKVSKHEKLTHGDGKRVGDDKSNHSRSQDDDECKKSTSSWEEELHGCRYLRHKRHSTPDVLDTEAIFDLTPDK